jgi:SAM-dependent methyltransferase
MSQLTFTCNICGTRSTIDSAALDREAQSCDSCHSTPRVRSIIFLLSRALFGKDIILKDFPARKDLIGYGMSDVFYDRGLEERLGYTNTFLHQEPRLDITAIDENEKNKLDFLISSDCFEHVPPPVQRAFDNAYALLKPGGWFVLTVPFMLEKETREHFPELHDYKIAKEGEHFVLHNTTRGGQQETFSNLTFHGGPGSTLEMRVFSEAALLKHLAAAGFTHVEVLRDDQPQWGIVFQNAASLPIVARKPLSAQKNLGGSFLRRLF